jgi:hypothetical protein
MTYRKLISNISPDTYKISIIKNNPFRGEIHLINDKTKSYRNKEKELLPLRKTNHLN